MDKFDDFYTSINTSTKTTEEVDKSSKTLIYHYRNNKNKLGTELSKMCTALAGWIKLNFSSPFLPYVFRTIVNLYEEVGFTLEFDLDDYYKTNDKLDEKDPKTIAKSDLEGFDDDKEILIDNPLLSFEIIQVALSLIENMVSKKMHISHKNLLILVLPILSIYSIDKKVQNIIRKKKFLKMILKIFKDVVESSASLTEIDIQICSHLLHTTAKLTYHNKKNQDYMIKKKGYEYIKGVIATSQDLSLLQGAICTFCNLSETNDGRLVLWCAGHLPILTQRIKVAMNNIKKYLNPKTRKVPTFKHALRDLELCFNAIWKFSSGTDEVIEDCLKNKDLTRLIEETLELMEMIRADDPQYLEYIKCTGLCLAIIRRFASSTNFRTLTVERFLKYTFRVPKYYSEEIKAAKESHSFLLKELAGLVGVVALDSILNHSRINFIESITETLMDQGLIMDVIKIAVAYFDSPKLIKTVLGFLTNVNAYEIVRSALEREKDFYVLLFNVLDKYDYSNLIIDYSLKLILNTSQNGRNVTYFTNTSQRFFYKFIYLFHVYLDDDFISSNMIKLFRILTSKLLVKAMDNLVASIKEYESFQPGFEFISALVENIRIDDYQYAIDVILLISTLSQNNDLLRNKIKENKKIIAFMNAFINFYKDKPEIFKLVSSSLACLPLEDLSAFS